MRKAFDHDRLSYNRRTDQEYREVKKTYLSVLLSGTPSQVKPLIPTAENGLFSRQVFYYMPAIHHWQNQFDRNDSDLEDTFKALGMEWKEKMKTIVMNGIFTLHLTDGQKDEFNRLFSRLFIRSGLANGNEMSSSVARLAINICRIMEVVAMLRAMEQGEITASPYVSPDPHTATDNLKDHIVSRWDLLIASDDFHAVLSLAESLYRHTTHILSFLPPHRSDKPWQCRPGCAGRQHGRRIHKGLFPAESRRDGHQIGNRLHLAQAHAEKRTGEICRWQGEIPETKSLTVCFASRTRMCVCVRRKDG